jgi:hypothetical protein
MAVSVDLDAPSVRDGDYLERVADQTNLDQDLKDYLGSEYAG